MRKKLFKNKVVCFIIILISAVLLTPVVGDCAYFFMEESLQKDVVTMADQVQLSPSDQKEIEELEEAENEYYLETQLDQIARERYLEKKRQQETEDATQGLEESTEESTEEAADEPEYFLKINRAANCVTVYKKGEDGVYSVPYKAIVCSTGKYNRTPLGTYALSSRYRWRKMVGGVYSQYATRVHGSILIHSVPYYRQNSATLETNQYNKLGEQASLGCIRMSVQDAKWIFDHCGEGTLAEVYEDAENPGPLGKPEAIIIDTTSENKGWDPTDPAEDNPWLVQ